MHAGIYRHYKGGYYQCLGVGAHTETGEHVVVYIALTGIDKEGPRIRVRPLEGSEGWNTAVLVNGTYVRRFEHIGDEIIYKEEANEKVG